MPPAEENTPDFDSMSPEELMAWMETLAERQGATEGFTTETRVDIAEIDPDTVEIDEPGYIPYGMEPEEWARRQEAEAAARAAKVAAAPPPAPVPVEPPPPTPEPVAAMPEPVTAAGGEAPDFDSMSPEELMAWMETLAERQGATEGFTTETRAVIAEIDPDTVEIDEPGYIPYGMEPEEWARRQEAEAAARAAKVAAAPAPVPVEPPPPTPEPVAGEPEPVLEPELELPVLSFEDDLEPTDTAPVLEEGASLEWLESLAAVDLGDELGELDLSAAFDAGLGDLVGESVEGDATDPMTWLEGLAEGQGTDEFDLVDMSLGEEPEPVTVEPVEAILSPLDDADVDPVEWLESLAKRQGADEEEFVTDAGLDIPMPEQAAVDGPGYSEYTFESDDLGIAAEATTTTPISARDAEELLAELDDPADWLDQLASSQVPVTESRAPVEAPESDEDVMDALDAGEDVSPEAIAAFFEQQLDRAEIVEETPAIPRADTPPVPAEIPDWLVDQIGAPPSEEDVQEAPVALTPEQPAFNTEITEPPAVDVPDWLVEDIEDHGTVDIEDIFATSEESTVVVETEPEPEAPATVIETVPTTEETGMVVDTTDPWVEAFELEHKTGELDINKVPEWYRTRMQQDTAEALGVSSDDLTEEPSLEDVTLEAEAELAAGELEAVPDWIDAPVTAETAIVQDQEMEVVQAEIPDWLADSAPDEPAEPVEVAVPEIPGAAEDEDEGWLEGMESEDVPGWLLETLSTGEQEAVAIEEGQALLMETEPQAESVAPAPAPAPQPATPAPVGLSPAPVPVAAADIDVEATLNNARSKVAENDVNAGLEDYEAIVRANVQLDTVVADLQVLMKEGTHKVNPAVYRVLGDALMRQGQLQAALDTYRRALNLL